MDKALALKVIAVVSFIGLVFAAYMTYYEMTYTACPASGCSTVLGIPACIHGLVMYLIIFVLSMCAVCGEGLNNRINNRKNNNHKPEAPSETAAQKK